MLQLFVVFVLLILAFFINRKEAVELRHGTSSAETILVVVLALGRDFDRRLIEHSRRHLRCDESHPDQPVQLQLVFGEEACKTLGSAKRGCRTNRFVRILNVLLALVCVWRRGT